MVAGARLLLSHAGGVSQKRVAAGGGFGGVQLSFMTGARSVRSCLGASRDRGGFLSRGFPRVKGLWGIGVRVTACGASAVCAACCSHGAGLVSVRSCPLSGVRGERVLTVA